LISETDRIAIQFGFPADLAILQKDVSHTCRYRKIILLEHPLYLEDSDRHFLFCRSKKVISPKAEEATPVKIANALLLHILKQIWGC
jgi:hypothetical protein